MDQKSFGFWAVLMYERAQNWAIFFAFVTFAALRFLFDAWPRAQEGIKFAICAILLKLIVEIHKALTAKQERVCYNSFDGAAEEAFRSEVVRQAQGGGELIVRYLGLSGLSWPALMRTLTEIQREKRIKSNITIRVLLLNENWSKIDDLNTNFKSQCSATRTAVLTFKGEPSTIDRKWKVDVRRYTAVPQIWGVSIGDSALFAGTAYWRDNQLTGFRNGIQFLRVSSEDSRVEEFIGWFDYLWDDEFNEQ